MKPNNYKLKNHILTPLFLAVFLLLTISNQAFAQQQPSANAGEDFTACETGALLNGEAQNYETIQWTTNGDGTFADAGMLNTEYFPGPADLSAQSAEVCLTAFAGGEQATDCVIISLVLAPQIDLNVETASICYFDSYTFNAVEVSNYSVIQWFTTNGGGGFNNENIPNPTYFPSPTVDYAQGCIDLIALAQGNDPCETYAQDEMTLCFVPNPQVNLGGEEHTVCYNENYTFSEATVSGDSFIQWFSLTGGGYFENPNSINATYVPDPELDYPQGCVFIGVSVEPVSPCTGALEEYAQLCFVPAPEADAGNDATILFNETFIPTPTVSNQDEVLWETSGDGVFDNPNLESPTYTPGKADMQAGVATLTLNAITEGCTVSDDLTLSVITEQQIEFEQGIGGFSTYINTGGQNFEDIIQPIISDLIIAQNGTKVFWPEYNINTIDEMTAPTGFSIRMNNASALTISGTLASEVVDLPSGWSILPVPVYCNVDTQTLIDQLGADLIIVSEIDGGGILWPDGGLNTLTELIPGKAYNIKLANPGQVVFPACE
jgi:hypothetical protein